MVNINNHAVLCHIKNTGRLTELLVKDTTVYLQHCPSPVRKTSYDLIAVEKDGKIFNIDSQAPNVAASEYIKTIFPDCIIKREVTYGNSRFDFYIEDKNKKIFLEVKGVTLIKNGTALFPDAPTVRGIKHINELIKSKNEGYEAYILFVIQTEKVSDFAPNNSAHREFGEALAAAENAGVNIIAVSCKVTPDEMIIHKEIPKKKDD